MQMLNAAPSARIVTCEPRGGFGTGVYYTILSCASRGRAHSSPDIRSTFSASRDGTSVSVRERKSANGWAGPTDNIADEATPSDRGNTRRHAFPFPIDFDLAR